MFIKYSTNQIPPKKSRGKGSKGKKTADESQETVDVFEESKPEPELTKKKTSSKRRVKKKVIMLANDNIISDDADVALELAKSISQTKAEEAEATRKVHATHARIVAESVSESAKKKSGGRSSKSVVIQDTPTPSLTPQEQEAADIMQALKESKKISRRQPGTGGSNEGTGSKPGVPNESIIIFATSSVGTDEQDSEYPDDDNDDVKKDDKDGDADDEGDDHIRVRKDEDVEMKDAKVEESDKGKERVTDAAKEEAEKNSPDPVSISIEVTHIISSIQQTPTPIPTKPITTDAPTITAVVPESNALTVVELRGAKLEKDVSELKIVDHSTEALVVLKSQVPTVVDNILKIKKEQGEKQKKPQFTIKSTNKAALEEFDLKTLIEDENVMDKGVAYTIKDHKRKHDDDEDDDDEDPPTGPNQGKKTKRRRTKEPESSKKPSTTKEIPKGKTLTKSSKTGKTALAKEPVEEPIAKVIMDDLGDDVVRDDDQPQDTSKPKTRKTLNPYWFKQPLRPPTPDPEWNKRQVILDQPVQPWFNQMVSASKDPLTFKDLMDTPIDFSKYVFNGPKIENLAQDILLGHAFNLLKGTCSSSIELEYNFQECFNALIDKLDWNNLEGDRYPFDLSKPLPL
ncbi:hypothetical protein Tco_0762370 [Tanacetum coccineum]